MTLASESELVLFEREGGVATIAWNRPQTLNAISTEMLIETRRLIRALEEDSTFKALIITAVGRGFCSGMDVNDMKAREHEQVRSPFTWPRPRPDWQPAHLFRNASFPVIGAINGVAAGAGMSIALGTDIRVLSDQARLAPLFIKRGLVPDMGGSYLLAKAVGTQKALELIFAGEAISPERALELGLVAHVVPHDELMPFCKEMARKFAEGPSIAIALAKRAVYRAEAGTLEQDLEFGTFHQERLMTTADFREGFRSFIEKRPPHFEGH